MHVTGLKKTETSIKTSTIQFRKSIMTIFDIFISLKGFNNNVKRRSQANPVPYSDVILNETSYETRAELEAIRIRSGNIENHFRNNQVIIF